MNKSTKQPGGKAIKAGSGVTDLSKHGTDVKVQDDVKEILLEEYKFMQKSYELQFNHFMGVFLFWSAVVTLPTAAGIVTSLGQRPIPFGCLCLFISIVGTFLSTKMFDIRGSQIRYLTRVNEIRQALWKRYEIEKETKISPMGKEIDLYKEARRDFGLWMAVVMSLIDSVILSVGVHTLLKHLTQVEPIKRLSSGIGITLFAANLALFFLLIRQRKVK